MIFNVFRSILKADQCLEKLASESLYLGLSTCLSHELSFNPLVRRFDVGEVVLAAACEADLRVQLPVLAVLL